MSNIPSGIEVKGLFGSNVKDDKLTFNKGDVIKSDSDDDDYDDDDDDDDSDSEYLLKNFDPRIPTFSTKDTPVEFDAKIQAFIAMAKEEASKKTPKETAEESTEKETSHPIPITRSVNIDVGYLEDMIMKTVLRIDPDLTGRIAKQVKDPIKIAPFIEKCLKHVGNLITSKRLSDEEEDAVFLFLMLTENFVDTERMTKAAHDHANEVESKLAEEVVELQVLKARLQATELVKDEEVKLTEKEKQDRMKKLWSEFRGTCVCGKQYKDCKKTKPKQVKDPKSGFIIDKNSGKIRDWDIGHWLLNCDAKEMYDQRIIMCNLFMAHFEFQQNTNVILEKENEALKAEIAELKNLKK